ncbi:hypothetical protein SEPCBS119000_002825 [Sporothrix epigloea]|uniref:Prp 4 CRoW domain-containing protein n=1 Tax=Sporothrix epigloea TaxID=1892477 RepID=A0ABP0DLT9_9PEZI
MHLSKSSALAILAAASQAAAEPAPYKAENAGRKLMSARDIFAVRRDGGAYSYTPSQSYCGMGDSCAAACGAGYETCTSTDDAIHCYDPSNQQVCCPDGSGNSCDAGYYCTGTHNGETVCCPNSQSLAECAAAYSVTGSLTSETAAPTSSSSSAAAASSSSSSSSVPANSTSSSVEAKTTAHHGVLNGNNTLVTLYDTSFTTTSCPTSTGAIPTYAGSSNYTTFNSGAAPTASEVATSAGGLAKPAGVAVAMLAAALTFLL